MLDQHESELFRKTYYSIGGGFVVDEEAAKQNIIHADDDTVLPYPFKSMTKLLKHCTRHDMSINQVMIENEKIWLSENEIRECLLNIWQVMQHCIQAGCDNEGILPGGLNVKCRAPPLYKKLHEQQKQSLCDPLTTLDWMN